MFPAPLSFQRVEIILRNMASHYHWESVLENRSMLSIKDKEIWNNFNFGSFHKIFLLAMLLRISWEVLLHFGNFVQGINSSVKYRVGLKLRVWNTRKMVILEWQAKTPTVQLLSSAKSRKDADWMDQ